MLGKLMWNFQLDRKKQPVQYSKHRPKLLLNVEYCSDLIVDGKRQYLDDMKPFSDFFTLKNITLQLSKALLIPANTVTFEYNNFLLEERDDDFDWKGCMERNFGSFLSSAKRCLSTSFLKKIFETLIQKYLSPKYCDKLSKDLSKSMLRKIIKFSRFTACKKIFFTALWGNSLFSASCFVFDVAAYMTSPRNKSDSTLQCLRRGTVWITRKTGYSALSLVSTSLGFAIGAYFNVSIMAPLCSGFFDIATSIGVSILSGEGSWQSSFTGIDSSSSSGETKIGRDDDEETLD